MADPIVFNGGALGNWKVAKQGAIKGAGLFEVAFVERGIKISLREV